MFIILYSLIRFDQPGLKLASKIEQFIIKAGAIGFKVDHEETKYLITKYPEINLNQMLCEIGIFPSILKQAGLQKVTTISTIINAIKLLPLTSTELIPNLMTLLKILLTFPSSGAAAERSFSALKRLKTYLRSTMSQQRLSELSLLHVHKDRLKKLNLNKICASFITNSSSKERIATFGSAEMN